MFRNYLLVAFRNIRKYKFFSFINIAGLTVGMACCLLLFVYVIDELSYDKFHWEYEKVYRIGLHGRIGGQELTTSNSSLPVGPTMQAEIPGLESVLRLKYATRGTGYAMRNGEKIFTEERIVIADSNFFTFFSFRLIQGDARTALNEPNSIVLTEALALKYFGTVECIGQTLVVGNNRTAVKVTGIAAEAPSNSHFYYQAVLSFATVEKDYFPGWGGNSWQTYARVNPKTSIADIQARLDVIVAKNMGKELEEGLGISFDEFKKQGGIYSYYLYPMADTRLRSSLQDDMEPNGSLSNVYIFSGVGLFILLIACVNFMNLSTAKSAGRAKEVGLRKTLGSQRTQMIGQFLSESFLYSAVAVVGAIALSYLLLPSFNRLAGKELELAALANPSFAGAVLVLLVLVGFVAGSYPAFYMTSFSAVDVLKGKARAGVKSKGIRSSLVVFQFAISTFLIVATVIVFQQLEYMQSKNLGMDKANVLTITGTRRLGTHAEAFKTAVSEIPGVQLTSFSNNLFPGSSNNNLVREKNLEVDHILGNYSVDWDHLDVMKISLAQGRFFDRANGADSLSCVINEAAVREFGFADPIGRELTDYSGESPIHYRVIGVLKDFNYESLKDKVRPVMVRLERTGRFLDVRYEGDPRTVVESLEKQWRAMAPGEPFEYTFMDQSFDAMFRAEMRLRDIFTVFSLLAIIIACLGLFALASFTTEQRTKEIGVRKAMGASVFSLTYLLSKEFTRLVLIAIVPAIALGWYVANWWLSSFTYRITLNPLVFAACGLLAIVIAWATVSYQAIRAATVDPVRSLRYE
jgi:putative ABC transport system permease protein